MLPTNYHNNAYWALASFRYQVSYEFMSHTIYRYCDQGSNRGGWPKVWSRIDFRKSKVGQLSIWQKQYFWRFQGIFGKMFSCGDKNVRNRAFVLLKWVTYRFWSTLFRLVIPRLIPDFDYWILIFWGFWRFLYHQTLTSDSCTLLYKVHKMVCCKKTILLPLRGAFLQPNTNLTLNSLHCFILSVERHKTLALFH